MIKIILATLAIIFLGACSFQAPQNQWQYKSSNAFSAYTKNFLSNNDILAQSDLKRAIKHAKQSANITQLAKVYLGECALNISVGQDSTCQKYKEISGLLENEALDSYYEFITLSLKSDRIKYLAKHYQEFAQNLKDSNYEKANEDIFTMGKATSTLLAGSLMRNNLSEKTRKHLIEVASFHGYKKAVLFWLNESLKIQTDEKSIQNIKKKIAILRSDS